MKLFKSIVSYPSVLSGLGWLNVVEAVQELDLTADGGSLPEGINDPVFDPTFDSVEFRHDFSINGSVLNYKLTNVTKNTLMLNLNIDINVMKTHPGWADQTFWVIKDSCLAEHKNGFVGQEPYSVKKEDLDQFLVNTISSKQTIIETKFPLKLFVPGKDISVDDLVILLSTSDPSFGKETTNITGITDITEIVAEERTAVWPQLISPITSSSSATTVSVGDDIIVNVTADPLVKEIYLEPVVGITNKTRVRMTNGQGSYIIKTGDLESGDEVRIKHGYKWFTGVSEFTKTIS